MARLAAVKTTEETEALKAIMNIINTAQSTSSVPENVEEPTFDRPISYIRETNNYKKFKPFKINRDVTKTRALEASMNKYGFSSGFPLVCTKSEDGMLMIIAGHHRFETAKKLGKTVKYVVLNLEEIPDIHEAESATNRWDTNDFLSSHIRAENNEYFVVEAFHKRTGISLQTCMGLLNGITTGNGLSRKFREGSFKARNIAFADRMGKMILTLKSFNIGIATASNFVSALSKCALLPEFSDKEFLKKADMFRSQFIKHATAKQYLQMIEGIYNYHRRDSDKLSLVNAAESAAKQRANNTKSLFDEI